MSDMIWVVLYHHRHGTSTAVLVGQTEPTLDEITAAIADDDPELDRDDEWVECHHYSLQAVLTDDVVFAEAERRGMSPRRPE